MTSMQIEEARSCRRGHFMTTNMDRLSCPKCGAPLRPVDSGWLFSIPRDPTEVPPAEPKPPKEH